MFSLQYEKLDTYLSERENALELCRDELKGVKTANRDLRVEVDNLENQLFEQKSTVERLEKQKDRFTRSKEDVALVTAHNELKKKYEDAQKELQTLQVNEYFFIMYLNEILINSYNFSLQFVNGTPNSIWFLILTFTIMEMRKIRK